MEAIPGSEQVADVGTKVMTSVKLCEMKNMMGMGCLEQHGEEGLCGESCRRRHARGSGRRGWKA